MSKFIFLALTAASAVVSFNARANDFVSVPADTKLTFLREVTILPRQCEAMVDTGLYVKLTTESDKTRVIKAGTTCSTGKIGAEGNYALLHCYTDAGTTILIEGDYNFTIERLKGYFRYEPSAPIIINAF